MGSPPALPFFTDKNFEPASQALAGRPNVEKPEQDNASHQQHPKLEVNIRDREVRDQPLPHLLPPPLDVAPPIMASPEMTRLDVPAAFANQDVFSFGGVVFEFGNGSTAFSQRRLLRPHR
jgi:hypothetical protein